MAGQLKEVRSRIKSVQSTQQITKAMKMVSAAKLRKSQDAIIQMRPYANKLKDILNNIIGSVDTIEGLSVAEERKIERVLLIVISSDRGLCGAYNTNIVKLTKQHIATHYASQNEKGNVSIWNVGKKGYESLSRSSYKTDESFKDIFLSLSFSAVKKMAEKAIMLFESRQVDKIEIVYSEFKNAASQQFVVESFLPVQKINAQKKRKQDFIFQPQQETLIHVLIPKILNTQLYKSILDAQASEHGARMTAMDKASENANELLKTLKISYNRARQAAITTELTEIVSGAAALNS